MLTEEDYEEEKVTQVFLKFQPQLASADWGILRNSFGDYIAEVNEDYTIAKRRPDVCGCADWFFAESKNSAEATRVGVGCIGHGRSYWIEEGIPRPKWMVRTE